MRILKILSVIASIVFFTSVFTFAQTVIPGGDVYGNWNLEGSPYQIMGDINIPDLTTLAIEPGVTVDFQGHYALYVNGRLLANGSETDTIVFTVNDTTGFFNPDTTLGSWYGIRFTVTPEQNDTSKLLYCKIQYGKAIGPGWWLNAGGGICIVNFDKVIISNCLITHNMAAGADSTFPAGGGIHLAWSDVILTDNIISYNSAVAGGAIQIHDSHPTFANNTFVGNMAQEGAGISTGDVADISFNGDAFINNISLDHGGGIMCWNPLNWSFNNVTFSGNVASWGAGLGISGGNVSVTNCTFENNKAYAIGGGIAADFCNLNISNTLFMGDSSYSISGAVHNWYCNTEILGCSFFNNYAVLGGALYADFSTVKIDQSSFIGNSANDGGALRFWTSNLELDSVLFQENHAYNQGGAFEYIIDTFGLAEPYHFKMENTQLIGNTADFRCGAISLEQINSDTSLINISIEKCKFYENHAERIGAFRIIGNINDISISNTMFKNNSSDLWTGCITISNGGSGDVDNCLFAFNTAGAGSSGAAGSSNGGHINYINCTFAGNSGATGGGIGLRNNSTANVINSIFWGNSPNQFSMVAVTDSTPCHLFLNYCDIQHGQDSISSDTISIVDWGSGNIDAQPMFEDILNDDFTLSNISPCIGVAIDSIQIENDWFFCPEIDIVGNPRPNPSWTMPDMGAYESEMPDTLSRVYDMNSSQFSEIKCRPNPFLQNIFIEYRLSQACNVELVIFNNLGVLEKHIMLINQDVGKHELKIDCTNLSSGIYYCNIITNDKILSTKLVKVD